MIAAIVAPVGIRSIAMMRACLVSGPAADLDDAGADRLPEAGLAVFRAVERSQPSAWFWAWSWDPLKFMRRHPPHHLSPARANHRQGRTLKRALAVQVTTAMLRTQNRPQPMFLGNGSATNARTTSWRGNVSLSTDIPGARSRSCSACSAACRRLWSDQHPVGAVKSVDDHPQQTSDAVRRDAAPSLRHERRGRIYPQWNSDRMIRMIWS